MAALAFDRSERAKVGIRSREWTAVAPTELDIVLEMARCLRGLGEGRALLLVPPLLLALWVLPASVWVYVSSHRVTATLLAGALGCLLLAAMDFGGAFALRFHLARPEFEAIAHRVLATRTDEFPLRSQWLSGDGVWY